MEKGPISSFCSSNPTNKSYNIGCIFAREYLSRSSHPIFQKNILHVVLNALSATKSWLHFVSLKTFVDFYFLLEECSSLWASGVVGLLFHFSLSHAGHPPQQKSRQAKLTLSERWKYLQVKHNINWNQQQSVFELQSSPKSLVNFSSDFLTKNIHLSWVVSHLKINERDTNQNGVKDSVSLNLWVDRGLISF